MKPTVIKPLIFTVLLMLGFVLFLGGCSKELLPASQNTTVVTTPTIPVVDTLPSFDTPSGVAVDAAGNIYVADYGNNVIRKITPKGVVSTFAGSGLAGQANGTGVASTFNLPKGITIDASGNLYVADCGNNLVRKITAAGVVTTIPTTGLAIGGIDSALFSPAGITVDAASNLYVADSGDDRIIKITSAGAVSTLAGNDNTQLTNGLFNDPTGVAVDASGNVYVANYLTNTIALVTASGIASTYAGSGVQGYSDGPVSSATFYFPNSVAVDAAKNVYVSDGVNNVIRKISASGIVSTIAGSGLPGAIDSTGTAASFNGPAGLALDASGNIYVADSNNNKIRKITPAGKVTTIAGNGEYGFRNGIAIAYRNTKIVTGLGGSKLNKLFKKP